MKSAESSTSVIGMMRRLTTSVVLVLAAFASGPLALGNATAPSDSPHHVSAAAPTVVQHVRPVGKSGNLLPGYLSANSRSGAHCSSGSEAIGNAAYRCIAHDLVYDPCWVTANRTFVDCLPHPWSFNVTQLHVTKGYNNVGLSSHVATIPWGLELTNGVLCGLVQGATGTVGAKRISYTCQHVKYVLVGKVDKVHSAWRIHKARSTGGGHYKLDGWVTISKAWLGKPSRKG
jgi:hypothetical protein